MSATDREGEVKPVLRATCAFFRWFLVERPDTSYGSAAPGAKDFADAASLPELGRGQGAARISAELIPGFTSLIHNLTDLSSIVVFQHEHLIISRYLWDLRISFPFLVI